MTKTAAEKNAERIAEGKRMRTAIRARTDWHAVAEDRAKELAEVKEREEYKDQLLVSLQERVQAANRDREEWRKAASEQTAERQQALASRVAAERDATIQARRADFWKGVAMGLDTARASEIENGQQERHKDALRPDTASMLYPGTRGRP